MLNFKQSWNFLYTVAWADDLLDDIPGEIPITVDAKPEQRPQWCAAVRNVLHDGILFCTSCCGFSPAPWSHRADTAGWQMWPINLILYKKLWSSEEVVALPCKCIRCCPIWGREGGEDRTSWLTLRRIRRGERKGEFFSLGQCKLLPFGSQCQVFLLHY